jgi:hypothetical protein
LPEKKSNCRRHVDSEVNEGRTAVAAVARGEARAGFLLGTENEAIAFRFEPRPRARARAPAGRAAAALAAVAIAPRVTTRGSVTRKPWVPCGVRERT